MRLFTRLCALPVSTLLVLIWLGCGGGVTSSRTPSPGGTPPPTGNPPPTVNTFLYVSNNMSGSVSQFKFDESSGALTPIASPLPDAADINLMAANPAGTVLFTPSRGANDIHSLQINPSTGQLSEGFSTVSTSGPYGIAVHPSGQFVYVSNQEAGTVSAFRSDAVGNLTPIGAPVAPFLGAMGINQIALNPAGTVLVAPFDTGVKTDGGVVTFRVDGSTGALTPATVILQHSANGVAITPDGRFALISYTAPESVQTYAIDSAGGLTPVGTPPGVPGIFRLAITPDGRFAYVVSLRNTVTGFAIQSDGSLVPVPNGTAATGDTPVGVAVDPASRFVVVTNSGSNDLSVYAIAATGSLTQVGATVPTGGSGPTSAVFVQH